jgi:hypothetical protein
MSEYLDKLKRRLRIGDTEQDALLEDLITDAAAFAEGYTGRAPLPAAADTVIVELAAVSFGRLGIEGQAVYAEGGISIRVDGLPAMLKAQLDGLRAAKVG